MYPFANQILGYQSHDRAKRIGALMLEVKGDFCHQIRGILKRYRREEDYIEIGLDSGYCYNPLHNDLDAYGLAYSIASLLNNLFGRGKEPFCLLLRDFTGGFGRENQAGGRDASR